MRLLCSFCVSVILLTLAVPTRCENAEHAARRYADAVQRAVADLEVRLCELPLSGGTATLGDWLPAHPEAAARIERALSGYRIVGDRMLENGALEVDVELPLFHLPAEVLAVLDDPGPYLLGAGTASGRVRATQPMDPREFWSRRMLRATVERGFRFTGLSREQQKADAIERSRGDALALLAQVLADLRLPDGRTYRELVPATTEEARLPRSVMRGLARTHARFDMADGSVEAAYELPLAPLATALGLLPKGWKPVPELAPGVDSDALLERARKDAAGDFAARIALWAPAGGDAAEWLRDHVSLLDDGVVDVLDPRAIAVTRGIPQEKIPDTVKKRLYGEAWFPVRCRGQAVWD